MSKEEREMNALHAEMGTRVTVRTFAEQHRLSIEIAQAIWWMEQLTDNNTTPDDWIDFEPSELMYLREARRIASKPNTSEVVHALRIAKEDLAATLPLQWGEGTITQWPKALREDDAPKTRKYTVLVKQAVTREAYVHVEAEDAHRAAEKACNLGEQALTSSDWDDAGLSLPWVESMAEGVHEHLIGQPRIPVPEGRSKDTVLSGYEW